ncbi:MAG: MlaD family protein [Planctomycetota bacterium]|jgi:ABC-type transporter Mla subunit MlaD
MNGGHFKLGLFVSVAVALLVLALLALGVLERFKPSITLETYFAESIQGLQPGAAVRYRGLRIGTVRRMNFADLEYAQAASANPVFGQVALVEMTIDASYIQTLQTEDLERRIERSIALGLRARLASSGLGGPTYIELDFLDPQRFPVPDLLWTPDDYFVPSAPSTIVSIVESLASILTRLDEAQFLPELRAACVTLQEFLSDERLGALTDDAETTLQQVQRLVADLTSMAEALQRAGTSFDGLAHDVEESDLIAQMQRAAAGLGPVTRYLAELAARLDKLVAANDTEIADTIRSLRRAALQLEALLEEAEANPSRMIFGDPPPKRTPGGSP